MNYFVRSISQMSAAEVQQYLGLFNNTFHKQLTTAEFYYKFSRQFGDASYFSMMVNDHNAVVGSVGAIEVSYVWRGREMTFGLTVDAMIDERYRGDFFALKKLHDLLTEELSRRKFALIFTKPNQNSYLYLKKMLGLGDLGKLIVHAFPLRPFRTIHRRLAWCDMPWLVAIRMIASRHGTFNEIPLHQMVNIASQMPSESRPYAHRLRDAEFMERRYGPKAYLHAGLGDEFVTYRILQFANRHLCFIMEASRLTALQWMAFACYVEKHHPFVELMLRLDCNRRHSFPFINLPGWLLADKLKVVGKVLNFPAMPADVTFSMELSDFEVV